jgi:hypothetical protein
MEFQIKQSWGNGIGGCIYFETEETDIEKIKQISIQETINDYRGLNRALYFSEPEPCKPTIYVTEYDKDKRPSERIQFKTKWR